jgi:hypothetical protein
MQTRRRVAVATEHRPADCSETLHRTGIAIAESDQLAIKHPASPERT